MKLSRDDVSPELWEKLLSQCRQSNADEIEIQVMGSTVYSADDPRKKSLKKFRLHWYGGRTEDVQGYSIADAIQRAGYGGGVLKALNYHEEI